MLHLIKAISEDIHGICTRPYVIGLSGNLVYRALRKRLVSGAVLLGTLVYLGNRAFNLDIRGLYIALGTLIVAIAAFVAQKWGKWALKRSLLFAETHGANLLEHKKAKRFKTLYLPELYENVYGLEAKLMVTSQQLAEVAGRHEKLYRDFVVDRLRRYSVVAEIKSLLESEPDRFGTLEHPVFREDELIDIDSVFLDEANRVRALLMDGALLDFGEYVLRRNEIVMSRLGFKAAVNYLLGRKDLQRDERMEAGLDLSFLEDYLDGAPFHPGNTKIMEQAQHGLMKEIDGAIGRRRIGEKLAHLLRRFLQKKWHAHINTSIQASVGGLLYAISKDYGTRTLAVEDVLWVDARSRQLLHRHLLEEFAHVDQPQEIANEIIQRLEEGSHFIFMKVFHDTQAEAIRVVRREYGYSIEESVYRRVRYDSEYACNELPERPLEDLELIGASDRVMDTTQRVMDRAAREIRTFRNFCAQTEFKVRWDRYSSEIRRALQLAYYINEANFKDEVARAQNGRSTGLGGLADRLAAHFTVTASKNLRQSRLHHQLAKFEYLDTLRQLGEMLDVSSNGDSGTPPG
ncbi:MAG: hypothetical protein OET21_15780 [Desulfobacterales bacterium]|nr:hypothetical protein [Desulfobacterales bacterium]